MSEPESPLRDPAGRLESWEQRVRDLAPRLRAVAQPEPAEPRRLMPKPAPLGAPARDPVPANLPAPLQRALNGLRSALPFVQKALPIFDGQILTAISNLLNPHATAPPPDLAPLEGGLADLRVRHIELFNKVGEQNTTLKRVAEHLEKVQEAADRSAQEQQELKEALKSVGRKANVVAIVALCLLALSIAVNVFLFFRLEPILR
jgi:hypothetical protein